MNRSFRPVLALLAVTLIGCAADGPVDNAIYTRTGIHLNADGTTTVTNGTITRSEQLREVALRERMGKTTGEGGPLQSAIMNDPVCESASLWVFDQTYFAGNEICFGGTGTTNLDYYTHTCPGGFLGVCDTWRHKVRSYYSGVSAGNFHADIATDMSTSDEPFMEWTPIYYTLGAARNAGTLTLY